MKKLISMDAQGRLTVPAAARQALNLEGPVQLELEVTADGLLIRLSPDAWAYTPQHLARVERARQQVREGRARPLTEHQLGRIS